ncbi:uncharacterized protein LOC143301260 [Babylonia areolata]|uniref:uncharacterized protein LOC143301260 n=1 Tax=Babylonia areolata TaxID=304850 RepID=UPI003FD04B44
MEPVSTNQGRGQFAHMQHNQRNSLEERIINYLRQQTALKAASQIVKHIGNCEKKAVNSILYRLEKQGKVAKQLQGFRPMWRVVPHDGWGGRGYPGYHFNPNPQWVNWGNNQRGGLPFRGGHFQSSSHGQTFPCSGASYPHPPRLPRGRGRGRGSDRGRGGENWRGRRGRRGQDNQNFSAHSSGFPPAARHSTPQGAAPSRHHKSQKPFDGKSAEDRATSTTAGQAMGQSSKKTITTTSMAPNQTGSSIPPLSIQASAQQYITNQTFALNCTVNRAPPLNTPLDHTSSASPTARADTADTTSVVPLKDRGGDTDSDSMDLEEEDDDFEAPTITSRFRDMMGTLMFDSEEDMMEEDEPAFDGNWTEFIVMSIYHAAGQTITVKELSQALKKTEEEVASYIRNCGDRVDISKGMCTLTSSGKAWAEQKLGSYTSSAGEPTPASKQGDNLSSATSVSSPYGLPLPPKEWLEAHPDLKNAASSPCSVVQRGEGSGGGGPSVPGNQSPSQLADRGITVQGSHDVRDVESRLISNPPSSSPVVTSTITTAGLGSGQLGRSSNQTASFRSVEEFEWKPLISAAEEKHPDSMAPFSVSSSSSPQCSSIGQIPQGAAEHSGTLEPSQLCSLPVSVHSPVTPVTTFSVSLQTSVQEPAVVNSQLNWMGSMSLQKYLAEGLTFMPLPPPSAFSTGSSGKTTASPGGSAVPFQKPPTPLELVQQERGRLGMSHSNINVLPPSSHPSLPTIPQSRSMPQLPSSTSSSLPPVPGGTSMAEAGGSSGAGASLQITAESFAALNKNPISALMEYAQSRRMTASIDVVSQKGPSHRPVFVMAARVGNRLFNRISCHNKKDGKTEAADVALRALIAEGQLSAATPSPSETVAPENMTHFDRMAALTHQSFNALIASIPENLAGRKVIAGLVMKRGPEDTGIVISIGTGNRCITGDKLSLEGNTVNDSHAEIITRRGFMRFLYQQLLTYQEGKPHELFEPSSGGRLRVKNTVTFHLYISTAPCGDGALFSPRDAESNSGAVADVDRREHRPTFTSNVQGLLRTKMEGGEGTIPVDTKDLTVQTWDGVVRGERLRTMSCTDKICRWNVLGMQGALLSNFLEPIYLDSLTLGFLYDHGHLSRAVCCRLAREEPGLDQELPSGFRLNHPWLGRVTACQPLRETQKTKAFSINWVIGDTAPEVLDGTIGHCYTAVEKKLFSRVSKRSLYDSFQKVAQHLGRSDLCQAASYHQAKMAATAFQTSKAAMFRRFRQLGCGWVKKPIEEEMFS